MAKKFSKRVENSVGKGEIARYEQFLLFPYCFLKTCTADTLKPLLVWETTSSLSNDNMLDFVKIESICKRETLSKLKAFASEKLCQN